MYCEVKVVYLDSLPLFPELENKKTHRCELNRAAVLQGGMSGGKASVALLAELPDGSVAMIETSAEILMTMAGIVRGACQRWGQILE
jgi:hypothetical protein